MIIWGFTSVGKSVWRKCASDRISEAGLTCTENQSDECECATHWQKVSVVLTVFVAYHKVPPLALWLVQTHDRSVETDFPSETCKGQTERLVVLIFGPILAVTIFPVIKKYKLSFMTRTFLCVFVSEKSQQQCHHGRWLCFTSPLHLQTCARLCNPSIAISFLRDASSYYSPAASNLRTALKSWILAFFSEVLTSSVFFLSLKYSAHTGVYLNELFQSLSKFSNEA